MWGSASAAYQIEGGWREDGKGITNWDQFVRIPWEKTYKATTGDVAVDHYHRYKEDIALMAEIGDSKTYRFFCFMGKNLSGRKRRGQFQRN